MLKSKEDLDNTIKNLSNKLVNIENEKAKIEDTHNQLNKEYVKLLIEIKTIDMNQKRSFKSSKNKDRSKSRQKVSTTELRFQQQYNTNANYKGNNFKDNKFSVVSNCKIFNNNSIVEIPEFCAEKNPFCEFSKKPIRATHKNNNRDKIANDDIIYNKKSPNQEDVNSINCNNKSFTNSTSSSNSPGKGNTKLNINKNTMLMKSNINTINNVMPDITLSPILRKADTYNIKNFMQYKTKQQKSKNSKNFKKKEEAINKQFNEYDANISGELLFIDEAEAKLTNYNNLNNHRNLQKENTFDIDYKGEQLTLPSNSESNNKNNKINNKENYNEIEIQMENTFSSFEGSEDSSEVIFNGVTLDLICQEEDLTKHDRRSIKKSLKQSIKDGMIPEIFLNYNNQKFRKTFFEEYKKNNNIEFISSLNKNAANNIHNNNNINNNNRDINQQSKYLNSSNKASSALQTVDEKDENINLFNNCYYNNKQNELLVNYKEAGDMQDENKIINSVKKMKLLKSFSQRLSNLYDQGENLYDKDHKTRDSTIEQITFNLKVDVKQKKPNFNYKNFIQKLKENNKNDYVSQDFIMQAPENLENQSNYKSNTYPIYKVYAIIISKVITLIVL